MRESLRPWLETPRARRVWAAVTLAALALVLLLPVWTLPYPPLLDYPNHLARAYVLGHLHDARFGFDQFYAARWNAYPYLTMDLALIGLNKFLPMAAAGRVFISLCLLALPVASWFFLQRACPGQGWGAAFALLVTNDVFFLYGFLNFQLGLAAMLFALAVWLAWRERPSGVRWLAVLAGVTLVYFTHLVPFALAGIIVTLHALLSPGAAPRERARTLLPTWLAFVPGLACYAATRAGGEMGFVVEWRPLKEKLFALPDFLAGFSPRLDLATAAALLALCFAARWRNREFRWNHPWPAVVVALFALYWVTPLSVGGLGWPEDLRLLPVVILLLPAAARIGPRRGGPIALALTLLFCARFVTIGSAFIEEQAPLQVLERSLAAIPERARVLPMVAQLADAPQQRYYAHFWAWGVTQRGWRVPYLLAAPGTVALYLPTVPYSPDGFWDLDYSGDAGIEWDSIAEEHDYVWAFDMGDYEKQLEQIGDVVFEEGEVRVYRLRKLREE